MSNLDRHVPESIGPQIVGTVADVVSGGVSEGYCFVNALAGVDTIHGMATVYDHPRGMVMVRVESSDQPGQVLVSVPVADLTEIDRGVLFPTIVRPDALDCARHILYNGPVMATVGDATLRGSGR